MNSFSDVMSDRFLIFAVNLIKLEKQICKTYSGRHIFSQLFRSSTSAGANYEEARGGESMPDFIHKMQIVLKELRESQFWIRLINSAKFVNPEDETLKFILQESKELANITAKSVLTAKSNIAKNSSR